MEIKGREGSGFSRGLLVSDDRGVNALDVLDAVDSAESLFELGSNFFVGIVDDESRVDLHESEGDGEDGGLDNLNSCRNDGRQFRDDIIEVDVGASGHEVVLCCDLSQVLTSGSNESAFLALVGDTLVAALGAPSDLVLPALGALEEGVSAANQPLPAGRANFVGCHAHAIILLIFKEKPIDGVRGLQNH